mgnify:CR=1 FL=1
MIIVPLAGPDFILSDGQVKAEIPYRGTTLLQACLESRPWRALGGDDGAGYVFVLYDTEATRAFTERYLRKYYPASRQVFLSAYTNGAAFSVLAGCGLAKPDETLVVDLADILYESDLQSPQALLEADPSAGQRYRVATRELPQIEQSYRDNSRELTLDEWLGRPAHMRIFDDLARVTAAVQ